LNSNKIARGVSDIGYDRNIVIYQNRSVMKMRTDGRGLQSHGPLVFGQLNGIHVYRNESKDNYGKIMTYNED